MQIDEAKELLKNAGYRLVEDFEENVARKRLNELEATLEDIREIAKME